MSSQFLIIGPRVTGVAAWVCLRTDSGHRWLLVRQKRLPVVGTLSLGRGRYGSSCRLSGDTAGTKLDITWAPVSSAQRGDVRSSKCC